MRCFFLAIHVTKRHLVLYIDVEFNTIFSSLAVSSAVSSLAVERIFKRGFFKRRPVSVFGGQAYTHDTVPFQLVANKRRSPNAGTLLGHSLQC